MRTPFIHIAISIAFLGNTIGPIPIPLAQAQVTVPAGGTFHLPVPGVMVQLSPEFTPAQLQGITIHPDNALQFDFLIYRGDQVLEGDQKNEEYKKLVKYFLASLTIPDEDQWVNLSPYENNRIIKDDFGKTEMGRDLLAEDYLLKQITSSLIYPEAGLGKKFWDKVYERAWKEYHSTNIPVNTFNKVWIVPDEAVVYESGNTAYILKSHLKVMLEEDYLSLTKHVLKRTSNDTHAIGSQVIREIILPELEKEINEGKNFSSLRQMYSGMVLATWYKKALRESLLGKVYADKAKVKGVDQNPKANEEIYQRYLKAFKKGVFNYIKEDMDKYTNEAIPRKYFSGGFVRSTSPDAALVVFKEGDVIPQSDIDMETLGAEENSLDRATVALNNVTDEAMLTRRHTIAALGVTALGAGVTTAVVRSVMKEGSQENNGAQEEVYQPLESGTYIFGKYTNRFRQVYQMSDRVEVQITEISPDGDNLIITLKSKNKLHADDGTKIGVIYKNVKVKRGSPIQNFEKDKAMNTLQMGGRTISLAMWERSYPVILGLWREKQRFEQGNNVTLDDNTQARIDALAIFVSFIKSGDFSAEIPSESFQKGLQVYLDSIHRSLLQRIRARLSGNALDLTKTLPYLSEYLRVFLLKTYDRNKQPLVEANILTRLKGMGLVQPAGAVSLDAITLIQNLFDGGAFKDPVNALLEKKKENLPPASIETNGETRRLFVNNRFLAIEGDVQQIIDARHVPVAKEAGQPENNEMETNVINLLNAMYKEIYGQIPTFKDANSNEHNSIANANGIYVQLKANGPRFLIIQTGVEALGPGQGTEPRTAIVDLNRMKAIVNIPYLAGRLKFNAEEESVQVTVADEPSTTQHEILNVSLKNGIAGNQAYLNDYHFDNKYAVVLEQDVSNNQFVVKVRGKSSSSFHVIGVVGNRKEATGIFDQLANDIKIGNPVVDILLGAIINPAMASAANNKDFAMVIKRINHEGGEYVLSIMSRAGHRGYFLEVLRSNAPQGIEKRSYFLTNDPIGALLFRSFALELGFEKWAIDWIKKDEAGRGALITNIMQIITAEKIGTSKLIPPDAASLSAGEHDKNLGGIDFNAVNLKLQIKRDGKGVPLPLALQDMAQLSHIQGFDPEIIEIRPALNIPIISELQQKLQTSST